MHYAVVTGLNFAPFLTAFTKSSEHCTAKNSILCELLCIAFKSHEIKLTPQLVLDHKERNERIL